MELARFLRIAYGSACELESHLRLAHECGLIGTPPFEETMKELGEIQKMLAGWLRNLRRPS